MNGRTIDGRNAIRVLVMLAALLALGLSASSASAGATDDQAAVFAPDAHPYGKSYGEWGAAWWTWLMQVPTATSPNLDTTGANCAANQKGKVWFLAGAFGGSVTRSCTVPQGKALLFPVANVGSFGWAGDQPGPTADLVTAMRTAKSMYATIDGASVRNIKERYLATSPLFTFAVPADNFFGVAQGTVITARDAGYYLMVRPLEPGRHTIRFGAAVPAFDGPDGPFSVSVTYNLRIRDDGQSGHEGDSGDGN